jgi:hypothetical protein
MFDAQLQQSDPQHASARGFVARTNALANVPSI